MYRKRICSKLLCSCRLRAEEEQRRLQEARERQERAARQAEEERARREEERRSKEEEERRQKEQRWKDMQDQLDREVGLITVFAFPLLLVYICSHIFTVQTLNILIIF